MITFYTRETSKVQVGSRISTIRWQLMDSQITYSILEIQLQELLATSPSHFSSPKTGINIFWHQNSLTVYNVQVYVTMNAICFWAKCPLKKLKCLMLAFPTLLLADTSAHWYWGVACFTGWSARWTGGRTAQREDTSPPGISKHSEKYKSTMQLHTGVRSSVLIENTRHKCYHWETRCFLRLHHY